MSMTLSRWHANNVNHICCCFGLVFCCGHIMQWWPSATNKAQSCSFSLFYYHFIPHPFSLAWPLYCLSIDVQGISWILPDLNNNHMVVYVAFESIVLLTGPVQYIWSVIGHLVWCLSYCHTYTQFTAVPRKILAFRFN